jgi:hypothetical protein
MKKQIKGFFRCNKETWRLQRLRKVKLCTKWHQNTMSTVSLLVTGRQGAKSVFYCRSKNEGEKMSELKNGWKVYGSNNRDRRMNNWTSSTRTSAHFSQEVLMRWAAQHPWRNNWHIRNLLKFWGLQSLRKNNDHMNNGSKNFAESKNHLKIPGARRVTSVVRAPLICSRITWTAQ